MLARILEKVKYHQQDLFFGLCLMLIAFISYNLGLIRALEKTPITLGQNAAIVQTISNESPAAAGQPGQSKPQKKLDPRVVTSKASTSKKYHYSWCASGKKIKAENQVWFDTEAAAKTAGYTLAGNCQ